MENKTFSKLGLIDFPKANNVNINMMPFIIGDKFSIPEEYRHYYSILEKCKVADDEIGKVGFLSISENMVIKNNSQRRGGIHTEKHQENRWGGGSTGWGGRKGLFMASTVDNSCRAWDVHIENTGVMGDCEYLRNSLGEGELMKANELIWMTDSCPHESMPLEKDTYRQWFRFVTSEVGLWYEKHSTSNRLGVIPNCKIITESKF